MITRMLCLAGGVAGALGLSQFPEFSQQYLQRLAGHVDALSVVVQDFERSAARNALSRDEALAQMTGSAFLEDRQRDLSATFARHAQLSTNLTDLRDASPLERLIMPHKLADPDLISATWADFRPAVPATIDGILAAIIGYVLGWLSSAGIFGLIARPFRKAQA